MSCLEEKRIGDEARFKKSVWITATVTLVMLFFCAYTSPLYPHHYVGDNAIFMLIGKGITEGKICYSDLFDHKGPILFFIQALGWSIAGRTGVWIIEWLFTLISVVLILKICKLLKANSLLPIISSAAVYLYAFGSGDLCENYCMVFIYLSVYFAARYFLADELNHPPLYAFIYGLCFGIIAFIRVNNAIIICVLVLCIIIDLIKKKQIYNLILNLCTGLLGIAVVAVPICIYCYVKNALYDMLYATFLYNLLYAESTAHVSIFSSFRTFVEQLLFFSPVVFSIIAELSNYRETKSKFSLAMFVTSVLCFLMLIFMNMSLHYFVPAIPVFTVAVALLYPNFNIKDLNGDRIKKIDAAKYMIPLIIIVSVYAVLSSYRAAIPIYKVYLTDIVRDRYEEVQKCIQVIPENERDSVIGYEIATTWYLDSGITPCYKYYSMQHWWSTSQNDVNEAFVQYVDSKHPLWLITPENVEDEKLSAIIDNEYKLMTVGDYDYYRYCGVEN